MLIEDVTHWQFLYPKHHEEMRSRLLSVAFGSSPLENIVQLSSAAVIIFEHSFYIHDKRRRLRDQQESVPSFDVALEQYIASPHAGTVREAVSISTQAYQGAVTAAARAYEEAVTTAAHAYEEAVSAAVYTYQGNLPAWMAKFEPFKRKAKQSFERSKEKEKESVERSQRKEKESSCSQAKADFIKTILEITLNHRLPRP
ncbi:hypothetical protein P692DRAFT_201453081 [Suillus brevipes Sb2]|nr:hypothetical protein P692DRAFT_201453081 [Suillus brevipes Sb2]